MAGRSLYARHRGLIGYTSLNYLDKLLAFGVPLLVLYLLHDRALYNEIEYIYSIAAIVSIAIELGVRNYFLYAYKESNDREALVAAVRASFLLQFAIYAFLSVILLGVAVVAGRHGQAIVFLISVRALFMYFLSFSTIYYRLVDRPSSVFGYSIAVNLLTLAIVLMSRGLTAELPLSYFFAGQMILVSLVVSYYLRHRHSSHVAQLVQYVRQALVYAWPIILNLFLFMFINNYGKVYSRNALSESQMFHIAFVQRVALILYLSHASAVGYLSKRVFVEKGHVISTRILALYSVMMALSVAAVFGILLGARLLELEQSVPIDMITVLVVIYTLGWCYTAYFEMYINKMNSSKYMLLFSAIATVAFVGIVALGSWEPLVGIALGMAVSKALSLALVLAFLVRRGGGPRETTTVIGDSPAAV